MAQDISPSAVPGNPSRPYAHVHVRVGRCEIAVPIANVLQALPMPLQGLTVLPRRSGALLGLADVAGVAVPIVALERWLPMDAAEQVLGQRLLVLQDHDAQVGIRVDAIVGVHDVSPGAIRPIHQEPDDNELFESVVTASAQRPTLCILEVARLMRLSQAWCTQAELDAGVQRAKVSAAQMPGKPQQLALFQMGSELWGVPVHAVQTVIPVPAVELALGLGQRCWALCQWQGRKLPLVDISADRQAGSSRAVPWMVLVSQGTLAVGLTATACHHLLEVSEDTIAPTPDDALMSGVAVLPNLGKLHILDVVKLFQSTPEASVSRQEAAAASADNAAAQYLGAESSAYLVFDADKRYASPVTGVVGVVELPQQTRDDLRTGQPAALAWRGKTIPIVNLPAIGKASSLMEPRLAVLIQSPQDSSPSIGIAIKALSDWLPANSAQRSGLRMAAMGEMSLINAQGSADHANLMVVDLAQMAHMLG